MDIVLPVGKWQLNPIIQKSGKMWTKLCRILKGDIRSEFSGMEIGDLMYKPTHRGNKAYELIHF